MRSSCEAQIISYPPLIFKLLKTLDTAMMAYFPNANSGAVWFGRNVVGGFCAFFMLLVAVVGWLVWFDLLLLLVWFWVFF